jgi:hypothetical protein
MSSQVMICGDHLTKGKTPLKIDGSGVGLVVIDFDDYMAHAGNGFFLNRGETLATAGDLDFRIVTPLTVDIYMTIFASSTGAATLKVWEGTTKTHVGGNAVVPYNKKRNSANISDLIEACHTAAGSQSGTPMIQTAGSQIIQGSPVVKKLLLKADTAYLIEIVSGAEGNVCTLTLDWSEAIDYEETSSSSESSESSTSSISSESSNSSETVSSESSESSSSLSSESSSSSESL